MELLSLLAAVVAFFLILPTGTDLFEKGVIAVERKLDARLLRNHKKMHVSAEEMARIVPSNNHPVV